MIGPAPATVLEIRAASLSGPQLQLHNLQIQAQGTSPHDLHWQIQTRAEQGSSPMHWETLQAQGRLHSHSGIDELQVQASVQASPLGNLQVRGQGTVGKSGGQLRLQLQGQQIGVWHGWWRSAAQGSWSARLTGGGNAQYLLQTVLPKVWHPQGTLRAQLTARGVNWTRLHEAALQASLNRLQFSSPSGLQAAQDGVLHLRTQIGQRKGIWRGQSTLQWRAGAALWSPWYVSAPAAGVTLRGNWQYGTQGWRIAEATLRWPEMGQARFSVVASASAAAPEFHLQEATLAVQPLWQTWLRPILPNSGLAHRLEASGILKISGSYAAGLDKLRWQLEDGSLRDPQGQFTLQDLRSNGTWQRQGGESEAELRWLYGGFYGIPFGPLDAQFLLRSHVAELRAPVALSVLGGRVHIQHLQASWRDGSPSFVLGGGVDHIQLGSLTRTFGWPHFTGTLDAEIPQLRYQQGALSTSSVMRAHAFGGEISIDGLSVTGLFTPAPLLQTSIRLQNLQLKPLTDVFPVGYISGVLDGSIQHVTLLDWQPVAFDARIATRRTSGIPQKISAAAIEKLTKLGGGGISSFFQNIFLRFFHTFSYAKLGFGVDLRDGVATLSGVANTEDGGFYLLRGQGLPQVNIIGYNRRSNWQELLSRLHAVMEGKAQVATGD
ncbi:hypothetical protein HFU84_14305 [Acidithiobacillus sp. CV18-2]|uniref:Dicarboxylate transport domain-containing protein n=1 Tax=Igneacidithiobacillus copahuensis TaxID=2724909 RepID=A0AAE2YN66_9PROT|nr:hypothetical protein [Igneacidithiobacillus copahuensis]MBU2753972.1 hypothetical protein [Acidithiobacillus sp. CV18-3]MBU2756200.1 hypothetical protein [Acidithiobacillus sp. BN09-2]MBU2778645.1 hypothetical protein [Acidithiobacillus sp. CV18-2]MBU2797212.1 hypothetical protein [Acidithiobacillus sp. VAN18-2]MBU2798899.1 hypothetical protein [Acidithiobacillus sp. VAN18-4]UTV81440.1 hypothetical protein MQE22_02155 [Acidithiobacillus sp. YTS05]